MKKFLAIFGILLYAFSCAGMDRYALLDELITATVYNDSEHVQAMLKRCDIPQEMLNRAYAIAMENEHFDLAHLLERLVLQDDDVRPEYQNQERIEQILQSAVVEGRLDDIQDLFASGYTFSQRSLNIALNTAMAQNNMAIVQWLFEHNEFSGKNIDVMYFAKNHQNDALAEYAQARFLAKGWF